MTKNLYLVVGKSGVGKDYVVNKLCERMNLTKVISHTTRPQRQGETNTHYFVSQEEFDSLKDFMVAYTHFNGFDYGTTADVVNQSDIYIIDLDGIRYLKKHQDKLSRPIIIIGISADGTLRFNRMIKRNDSFSEAAQRFMNDNVVFLNWEGQVDATFDNSEDGDKCVDEVEKFIRSKEEEQA